MREVGVGGPSPRAEAGEGVGRKDVRSIVVVVGL